MHVAVHWQDEDSSSAKAVRKVFPNAKVMICGGHAGRAHRKILELRQKIKKDPQQMLGRYKSSYPQLGKLTCKCMHVGKGNHSASCGCLTVSFISRAHTNFTSILMTAQSKEEFVKRLEALPKHAVMCMSGREEGVNSTHFGSAHVKNVAIQERYNVKEKHTKPG